MMNRFFHRLFLLIPIALFSVGCGEPSAENHEEENHEEENHEEGHFDRSEAISELRQVLPDFDVAPLQMPQAQPAEKFELGRMLFFEPELSGMRDTSCATCHRMDKATADGVSLPVGAGAIVVDGVRMPSPELPFMVRHSADLFNRGHDQWRTMLWDQRVEELPDGRFVMHDRYAGYAPGNYFREMPDSLDNVLAALAMFPFISRREMRGVAQSVDIFGEPNELAGFPSNDVDSIWRALMVRLGRIEGYVEMFEAAYPDKQWNEMTIVDLANAISAFIVDAFTFLDAPWDHFVEGLDDALTDEELRGALLFYGEAQCALCHSGALFTDQRFYNIAVPPMTRGPDPLENMDFGVAHRSHAGSDARFAFRVPPLRNVELTAPYMHNGAITTLEDVIIHKMDVEAGLWNYDPTVLSPEFRNQVHRDPSMLERVIPTISGPAYLVPELDEEQIGDLLAFLGALTSPSARDLEHFVPEEVPSGLPLNLPE